MNHEFVEANGTVLATRDGKKLESDGPTYRPAIQVRYLVNGEPLEEWGYDITNAATSDKASVDDAWRSLKSGKDYKVWYDPEDPHQVVLLRGYTWWQWLVLLVPVSFIAIGGAGLIYTLFSLGHVGRAALGRRAPRGDARSVRSA